MYAAYYGMKESPFSLAPNPDYVFWSEVHQDALAHLHYGVHERKGFVLLTGEVGVGKTLLCRCLLKNLGERVRTALILNPVSTPEEFLQRVNKDFGVRGNWRLKPLERLNRFLLDQYAKGNNCVLIIDEAQTLPLEVLEYLRLVSNLETESSKLLQILLVGQDELQGILNLHSMRQLQQRIAVAYHLAGLDGDNTERYIRHRLDSVSGGAPLRFTPSAVRAVYRCTGGNPRLINILCDRALLAAFSRGADAVNRRSIRRASREMLAGGGERRPGRGAWPRRLVWWCAACAMLAVGFFAGRLWGWP